MRQIKNIIVKLTKGNLLKFYIRYKMPNITEFMSICKKRSYINIFEYKEISKRIDPFRYYYLGDVNHYGLGKIFQDYVGNKINPLIFIEHGYIYYDSVPKYFLEIPHINKVVTFGNKREFLLKNAGFNNIVKVGPYIHYANPLLNKYEFANIKKELGKVLLVFPTHSIDNKIADYESLNFIKYIQTVYKSFNYDSVLICLYWKDIELGRDKQYLDKGFRVVTAGHINDLYFLHRLKSIILLSDMTLSNDIGTHTGYCIYMNRPHQIFNQEVIHKAETDELLLKYENEQIDENGWLGYQKTKIELCQLFGTYQEIITKEQYSYMSDLFGFNYISSKECLKEQLS